MQSIPIWRRAPRASLWLVLTVLLLLCIQQVAPQKFEVVVYKASLVSFAVVAGYWLDRSLFPYARPDGYLEKDWRRGTKEPENDVDFRVVSGYTLVFAIAMIRRALIVGAVVVGITMGL